MPPRKVQPPPKGPNWAARTIDIPKGPRITWNDRVASWRLAGWPLGGNVAQRQSGRFISARSLVRAQSLPPSPLIEKRASLRPVTTYPTPLPTRLAKFMKWIESVFRRISVKIGNSPGSVRQTMRNSAGAMQAGRDINIYQGEQEKSYPKIGEASFTDLHVALDVHGFSVGGDRSDSRYQASLATKQIASFVVSLREVDYDAFRIKDNQEIVNLQCTISVPEGSYKGTVKYIEIAQRGQGYFGLRCWLNISVDTNE